MAEEHSSSPIDIARQALKQLAMQKVPPTPDHFRHAYEEIAGVTAEPVADQVAEQLGKVLLTVGKQRPKYATMAKALTEALQAGNWREVEKQISALFGLSGGDDRSHNWGNVVRDLIKQLETGHKGITTSKKKEGLEKVLNNFGHDPDELKQKLSALAASWKSSGVDTTEIEVQDSVPGGQGATTAEVAGGVPAKAAVPAKPVVAVPAASESFAYVWRDLLLKTLEFSVLAQLKYMPELARMAEALIVQARAANDEKAVHKLAEAFKSFWYKLEINSDTQYRLHEELLHLLRLLVDNMSELVVDDQWLHGQTQMVRDIISKPLNIDVLYDAESNLKELIYKQGKLKHGVVEAQETLKQMAASFVQRLAAMSDNTGEFRGKIERYQSKLSSTKDISELNLVLDGLMQDTKLMQLDALRVHDEMKAAQQSVHQAEQRIQELTAELEKISSTAHEDYLTGTLNRRGMDEALDREFKRADRSNKPLCVALLDIDHFKKLNDSLGHDAGDTALKHLAAVTKETLRPTDIMARYGGEEFIIILPETERDEAVNVMTRVQRELTKKFFLHNNQKVLITFSAGVAQRKEDEPPEVSMKRADTAMYEAKHSGRNRVCAAE